MACIPPPTQTLFRTDLLTTQTIGTSTVQVLTTLPASSTTSTQLSCIQTAVNGTCQAFATTEVVVAIPGAIQTLEEYVPFTNIVTATNTVPTETLFAPCSQSQPSSPTPNTPGPPVTPTTTNAPPRPTTTKTITSSRTYIETYTSEGSYSYAPPTTITMSVTVTMPDGQVSTEVSAAVSTPSLWVPAPSKSSGSNLGLIVGSTVGGFAALSILAGIVWLLWRRRKTRWDDIFEDENELARTNNRRMELIDAEPKPYQYGIVGAQSPPNSPHLGSTDRRASSAPLLAGSLHSASQSMDYRDYPYHSSHTPQGSLNVARQPTGGSSVHSRDTSYHSGPSFTSARDRMPYADDHGVLQPFLLHNPSVTPAAYMQTDRKVWPPQQPTNLMSPVHSPPPQHGLVASSSASAASNADRTSPSTAPSPASQNAPSTQGLLRRTSRAGEIVDDALPPPYTQSAGAPSTVSSPSTYMSNAPGNRLSVANPNADAAGIKEFNPYR